MLMPANDNDDAVDETLFAPKQQFMCLTFYRMTILCVVFFFSCIVHNVLKNVARLVVWSNLCGKWPGESAFA